MSNYTLAIDTGGTFTDFALFDNRGGEIENFKVNSTPEDPSIGIINGIELIAQTKSLDPQVFLRHVQMIVHGTTVTTNAVLTAQGAKTALITTKGFRDILEMRRGSRPTFFNNKYLAPKPLVPRHLRFGVEERITASGEELIPLNINELEVIGRKLQAEEVKAIAICFMHSYLNPSHEKQAQEILQGLLPEAYITISSDILPQPRLYERVSTTVINSYVGPLLKNYLESLLRKLRQLHFTGSFFVVTSNGGAATPELINKIPAATLLSGPAAGPIAALNLSQKAGYPNCITMDMGGTSFEASLIKDGIPMTSRQAEVNSNALALPMLDIRTIGAGGGSIAWLDSGDFLHTGPQSAGAFPGPASYNLGGTEPTITDAALVLGLLDPDRFLNGRFPLSLEKAYEAIDTHIAKPLGMRIEDAAWGIYQVAITNMANSLKELTVQRGFDPREFLLVVGGGAGPLHCAYLARQLEISTLLIPNESSIMCAYGMLLTDLKFDYVRTYYRLLTEEGTSDILALFDEMLTQAKKDSIEGQRYDYQMEPTYSLDLRYLGQHNELTIQVSRDDLESNSIEKIIQAFHKEHSRQYGYSLEDNQPPIEVICLRLLYTSKSPKGLELRPVEKVSSTTPLLGYRKAYNHRSRSYEKIPVWDGTLPSLEVIKGPSLIEKRNTTVFIPTGFSGKYDIYGNLLISEIK